MMDISRLSMQHVLIANTLALAKSEGWVLAITQPFVSKTREIPSETVLASCEDWTWRAERTGETLFDENIFVSIAGVRYMPALFEKITVTRVEGSSIWQSNAWCLAITLEALLC